MEKPGKLTPDERAAIIGREGPMGLFVRLLAESESRRPEGWEHAAKMFAYVARETPERVDLGGAFRLERVLFASDVRNVSPSAHDGARFLPFDLPGCEFAEPQRVTHLLISAKRGATIRGGAFGYVPLQALSRAYCECGHLLGEHGPNWCSVLACGCRSYVERDNRDG